MCWCRQLRSHTSRVWNYCKLIVFYNININQLFVINCKQDFLWTLSCLLSWKTLLLRFNFSSDCSLKSKQKSSSLLQYPLEDFLPVLFISNDNFTSQIKYLLTHGDGYSHTEIANTSVKFPSINFKQDMSVTSSDCKKSEYCLLFLTIRQSFAVLDPTVVVFSPLFLLRHFSNLSWW